MVSLALEDGSQRELAIDPAGFSRAMDTAKRFFADANRGYKAHSCKSVTDWRISEKTGALSRYSYA
jgi:hypothetical protein